MQVKFLLAWPPLANELDLGVPNSLSGQVRSAVLVVLTNKIEKIKNRLLGVFGKLSTRRDAWAWFHGVLDLRCKVLEY